jgi:transcriptional regulator with GAF, ATPase, and Fis domain
MKRNHNSLIAAAVLEMSTTPSLESTLGRAVEMCVEVLPACDMAGISVVDSREIRTLAATSQALRRIDELQFALAEGPCLDALRDHQMVGAIDVGADLRWPHWGPRVAEDVGVHSALSFRLFSRDETLGALNLYAHDVGSFDHEDALDGELLAAHASSVLATVLRESQLPIALEQRTVLGQATGILIERYGLDADAAFGVMQRISHDRDVKLYRLAQNLVCTGELWGPSLERQGPPLRPLP